MADRGVKDITRRFKQSTNFGLTRAPKDWTDKQEVAWDWTWALFIYVLQLCGLVLKWVS